MDIHEAHEEEYRLRCGLSQKRLLTPGRLQPFAGLAFLESEGSRGKNSHLRLTWLRTIPCKTGWNPRSGRRKQTKSPSGRTGLTLCRSTTCRWICPPLDGTSTRRLPCPSGDPLPEM